MKIFSKGNRTYRTNGTYGNAPRSCTVARSATATLARGGYHEGRHRRKGLRRLPTECGYHRGAALR